MRFADPFYPPADPTMSGAVTGFSTIFVIVATIVVLGFVFAIVVGVRKYQLLRREGVDPLTVDAALAAKVLKSDALRPADGGAPTIETRLREVDDLRARGVISEDEHRAARAAILAG